MRVRLGFLLSTVVIIQSVFSKTSNKNNNASRRNAGLPGTTFRPFIPPLDLEESKKTDENGTLYVGNGTFYYEKSDDEYKITYVIRNKDTDVKKYTVKVRGPSSSLKHKKIIQDDSSNDSQYDSGEDGSDNNDDDGNSDEDEKYDNNKSFNPGFSYPGNQFSSGQETGIGTGFLGSSGFGSSGSLTRKPIEYDGNQFLSGQQTGIGTGFLGSSGFGSSGSLTRKPIEYDASRGLPGIPYSVHMSSIPGLGYLRIPVLLPKNGLYGAPSSESSGYSQTGIAYFGSSGTPDGSSNFGTQNTGFPGANYPSLNLGGLPGVTDGSGQLGISNPYYTGPSSNTGFTSFPNSYMGQFGNQMYPSSNVGQGSFNQLGANPYTQTGPCGSNNVLCPTTSFGQANIGTNVPPTQQFPYPSFGYQPSGLVSPQGPLPPRIGAAVSSYSSGGQGAYSPPAPSPFEIVNALLSR